MFKLYALAVFASLFISTLAHSQMRCAKYDIATGTCSAPIRNEYYSKIQEAHEISGGQPFCQFPMSNPISASYSNGAGCPDWAPCPSPMGTFQQGENFTIMWLARNHAVPDQNPGTIVLYLSPVETESQGSDLDKSSYSAICRAPYMSCNGQNGNEVQCYATCQMPTNAVVGIHTLWWKWDWQSAVYSTCADVYVTASSSGSTPAPTPVAPSTTGARVNPTTAAVTPVTPTPVVPSTTGARVNPTTAAPTPVTPSTTGARSNPTTAAPTPVAPSTTGAKVNPTPIGCTLGDQICVGASQYQTCTNGREINYWAPPQSCRTGLQCHPSTTSNNIYCY